MCCPRIVLIALWLILLVAAQVDMNSLEKRGGRRYCGKNLNNMLMLVCESVYKRSDSTEMGMMPSDSLNTPYIYAERLYFPYKPRYNALSLIPRQYKRRGVVDECCSKPCTVAELSSYCGPR